MFEYDKYAKAAVEKLDEYDFTHILSDCYDNGLRSLYDIRDKIAESHKELDADNGALENLSTDEFMEYICARYPVKFEEEITYKMWYRRS